MVRQDIWLVNLGEAIGSEFNKIRPCVIISPDEMNKDFSTIIIVPLTTRIRRWSFRTKTSFRGQPGMAAVEGLRAVSRDRLLQRVGRLNDDEFTAIQVVIHKLFMK